MVEFRMRYVTARRNRDGTVRWYWQRPGYPVVRLPATEAARVIMVARLNAEADGARQKHTVVTGQVAWAIQEYEGSEAYTELALATKAVYKRWLRVIREKWGTYFLTEILRSDLLHTMKAAGGASTKRHLSAVWMNIFKVAIDHDLMRTNPAAKLPVGRAVKRDVIWTEDVVRLWLAAARLHAEVEGMTLGFALLLFTAQRPCDVVQKGTLTIGMQWGQYNGARLRVRQQKTGKLVDVPCHSSLRPYLERAKARMGDSTAIVTTSAGLPMTYKQWRQSFLEICAAAGIEGYQTRDLRRTACVHLAEIGCSTRLIASISGHGEKSLANIIETYTPVTAEMGRQAMSAWETKGGTFGV